MALRQLNKYSNVGHTDVDAMFLTLDKTFKGLRALSLTEWNTTARPSIAAGGVVECNGALFIADIDEAIAENPPDGVVYVKLIPSGSPISLTAEFTEVAPVWSDSKQGWYSPTAGEESQVYVAGCHKAGTLFSGKGYFDNETPVGHVKDVLTTNVRFPYITCHYAKIVSRTEFAVLFSVIGTSCGAGDGYSTFQIPDFNGRAAIGCNPMAGWSVSGRVTGASPVGHAGGNEIADMEGEGGVALGSVECNVVNPYMAVYKAIKFI